MSDSADDLYGTIELAVTGYWKSMSVIVILVTFGLSLLCISSLLRVVYERTTVNLLSFLGILFLWSALLCFLAIVMHQLCYLARRSHHYYKVDENGADKVDICLASNCSCSEFSLDDSAVRFEMCMCGHPRDSHVILSSDNEYFEHPDNLRQWIQEDGDGVHGDDHVVV